MFPTLWMSVLWATEKRAQSSAGPTSPSRAAAGQEQPTGSAWPTQGSTTLLGTLCLSPRVPLAPEVATWVGEAARPVSHECH